MAIAQRKNLAYGIDSPLQAIPVAPIQAKRNPNSHDKAQIGTIWINMIDSTSFILTSITNNTPNWQSLVQTLPSLTANGQLIIGGTGQPPVAATLTAGENITITNGPGSISIAATGGGGSFPINLVSGSVAMTTNNGYLVALDTTADFTLPVTSAAGDIIAIYLESGLLNLAQGADQQIYIGGESTTVGVGHGLSSTYPYSDGGSITLRCVIADTTWFVDGFSSIGSVGLY